MAELDEYDMLEKQLEEPKKDREKKSERSSRSHKHSSRDPKDRKHSSRERERGKSKDRRRSRSRSKRASSRDRRRRSRSRSKDRRRGRSGERERRGREERSERRRPVSPLPPPRRALTPPEVREQRERERELMELDRDIRTIFAYNLPLKASEKELFQFFSSAGQIGDVRIIVDRNTRKSKGFAYIEYANREDIVKAMGLTGQLLMGQAVMVKSAEAEKNLAWEAAQAQAASMAQLNSIQNAGMGPCKLLVSNLHPNIGEGDLRQIFEPFGAIEMVSVQQEGSRDRQNFGFVQYTSAADANKAMQQLDMMDIAGNKIGVKVAPMSAGETAQLAANAARMDLDDEDDGGGMRLNSSARNALMNRLAGANGAPVAFAPPPMDPPMHLPGPPPQAGPVMSAPAQALAMEQGVLGPSSPRPTQCLLLKNMFNPEQETQPDWDKDIAEDVKEECGKFGSVSHVYVDRNSRGYVYLKFAAVEGAVAAQKALHGRWFAGNQVLAEFQFAPTYIEYFRCP